MPARSVMFPNPGPRIGRNPSTQRWLRYTTQGAHHCGRSRKPQIDVPSRRLGDHEAPAPISNLQTLEMENE